MSEKYLTKKEAAEILGVSERTIARYLHDGKLKGALIGKLWRITESDIKDFYEETKAETVKAMKNTKTKRKGGSENEQ